MFRYIVLVIFAVAFFTQTTLFVIPPVDEFNEGQTKLIWRMKDTKFIDSSDAKCEREIGGVNWICRGKVMLEMKLQAKEIFHFPYSNILYLVSTGGKSYSFSLNK